MGFKTSFYLIWHNIKIFQKCERPVKFSPKTQKCLGTVLFGPLWSDFAHFALWNEEQKNMLTIEMWYCLKWICWLLQIIVLWFKNLGIFVDLLLFGPFLEQCILRIIDDPAISAPQPFFEQWKLPVIFEAVICSRLMVKWVCSFYEPNNTIDWFIYSVHNYVGACFDCITFTNISNIKT